MKQPLDEKLCHDFPLLYKDRFADMRSTCMCWGFDCGDGWYQLIYDLSTKLEEMIRKLPKETRQYCCASQVKEKLGTLRFYMTSSTDEMENAIEEAENLSAKTCEDCGKPGEVKTICGWYYCRCPECFEKLEEEYGTKAKEFEDDE